MILIYSCKSTQTAVSDNDNVNGAKSTKSSVFSFAIPGTDQMKELQEEFNSDINNNLESSKNLSDELEKDINELREKLLQENVSDWEKYSARKKDHKLEELVEFVDSGEMPLVSYTWIHGDLSQKDAKLLIQWVEILRIGYQKEIAGLLK